MLRSVHMVSRGVVLATTTLAAGMALASSSFVARTAPSSTPVVFSAVTLRNVESAHALSGATVSASAHLTELILHVVDQTAEYVALSPDSRRPADPPTGIAALVPSADLVLATLAESGAHLLTHGTRALASSLAHRYGADVGDAVRMGARRRVTSPRFTATRAPSGDTHYSCASASASSRPAWPFSLTRSRHRGVLRAGLLAL